MTHTKTFLVWSTAVGRWTGCDWETAFGTQKLNLKGIQSRQARLLANVTSEVEAICWAEAALFLEQVEQDAGEAERSARKAVELLANGYPTEAIAAIDRAILLEAKYRDPVVWLPVRDAIVAQKSLETNHF